MHEHPIIVTDRDISRLRGLLGGQGQASLRDHGRLSQLQDELDRALVLAADEVPVGVVTIDSMVHVIDLDSRARSVLTLVLPREADVARGRISVLAPIGTALLGFSAGDDVEWAMPGGSRRLHIEHVIQASQVAVAERTRTARAGRYPVFGAN
jgi:regulator of nucleoside diphosphate kinase